MNFQKWELFSGSPGTMSTPKVHVNTNGKKNEMKKKGNSFARIMKRTNKQGNG